MALALSLLVGGLPALDLATFSATSSYFVNPQTMRGFGEPEIDADYADSADRHGSGLSHRRFRNRVVSFSLVIRATTGVDAREAARNAIADVIDQARRYQTGADLGTTDAEGDVVLKYCPPNGTAAVYARVIDGSLVSGDGYSSVMAQGSVAGQAFDPDVPVTLILEPFWRPERDWYLRNCLINGGFEAGYMGSTPYSWTPSTTGTMGATYGQSLSFARSGAASHYMQIASSTTAGTITLAQTITLSDVGLSAGQTVLVTAWAYIYSVGGTGRAYLTVNDGDAHDSITTTTGRWVQLSTVVDLKSGATSVTVMLVAQAQNIGDTILIYWDEVQVQPHVDTLLSGGGFTHDTDADGVADGWGYSKSGTMTDTKSLSTTAKYDENAQQIAVSASSTTGAIELFQTVTAATYTLRPDDAVTFGVWLNLVAVTGAVAASVRLDFLDANSRTLSVATDASPVTAASAGWIWHSVAAALPIGTATIKCSVAISLVSGATFTLRIDWATLYRGYSDQSSRRFWPYTDRSEVLIPFWTDSARLTSDPSATDGKRISLDHARLPGNVPGPAQLVIGVSDEVPNPLIVGYKRGAPGSAQPLLTWVGAESTTSVGSGVAAETADAAAIGDNARIWTPGGTTEQFLTLWTGADTPPGRYLVVLRTKLSDQTHYSRYSFRAAARLNNTQTATGSWAPILHAAPPWVNTSGTPGYELWPIGVIPLPLRSRLPAYVNATRLEVWGRASATGGTVSLDGVYLIPLDGYYAGQKSYYFTDTPASQAFRYTALIDSITPLPGGLMAYTNGTFPTRLPVTFDDQPDAEEEPIYLGDAGKLVVLHSGATHDKADTMLAAVLYRPWWSTAGVVS